MGEVMTEEIIIAGFGGQGVLSMGMLLVYAGMVEGKQVSWLPSYGPEMRGGTANCNVIISDEMVGSPVISEADTLIAMNLPSLVKFESHVKPGGRILVNSDLIDLKVTRTDVTVHYLPVNSTAMESGSDKAANVVMMGAYTALTGFPGREAVSQAFHKVFGEKKAALIPMNEEAFDKGAALV
ncbi:MAG: 2-oxoacid:acceptor oxidoreductase family protein [Spirochaetales bacterium]|jgi:2-oxoglutarate ferredoxin oxidoreductase subunit gamma|nr:2-oxoacid:acceptor oxidoreductase family protein [Spirochaetales bacterium]